MSRGIARWVVVAAVAGGLLLPRPVLSLNLNTDCCLEDPLFGTCTLIPKEDGTVCRPSAGSCDKAEVCNGISIVCPVDDFKAAGTACRPAVAGGCDKTEYCTGSSAGCPANTYQPSTYVCRAANGACDREEKCTGTSASCPADTYQPSTYACRAAAGPCDKAETCSGTSTTCPANAFLPPTSTCRASAGSCDQAETCSGGSSTCPVDAFLTSTTTCRAAAGACDQAETCSGTSVSCPADAFLSSTTTCRPATGACDRAETCSGASASCPADGYLAAGTTCRAAGGQCDSPETCSGTGTQCPADARASDGTSCDNVSVCVAGGTCAAGVCIGGTSEITFNPSQVTVAPTGTTPVRIIHSGSGSAVQVTNVRAEPASIFSVATHPTWPVSLATGQEATVAVQVATATPGDHDGVLIVTANGCSDLTVGLEATVPQPPSGGNDEGGCGHGPGGLLALLAPVLALAARRSWRRA